MSRTKFNPMGIRFRRQMIDFFLKQREIPGSYNLP
jgi:hypothetical protein